MGLFRQLLKVIEWKDDSTDQIVYRYPMTDRDEIMNGCQLVVRPSQVAILVASGQVADVYGEGLHKLTTNNMPILTKLLSWKYGFDSPFKAEVYYVNVKQFINLKWGTSSKVSLRDADFGIVRLGARGTYSFRVKDAAQFMREVFGTNRDYGTESLKEYFKSMIVTSFSDALGESKIPALDIPSKYRELSDIVKNEAQKDFNALGVEIVSLFVENVSLPEEVEKAIDQRSSLGAMSGKLNEFTQYQTAQAIRDAANNPNGGAGIAGMGVGFGAGMAMSQAMNQSAYQQPQQQADSPMTTCASCGQPMNAGAKFCPNCGKPAAQTKFCQNCGAQVSAGAKFCPNCGKQI